MLFATLTDGAAAQPVTTAPQIEIDINNGVDRYVFIGTGRLLDNSDLTVPTTPQTQTMYAIRDGTLGAFSTTGLPVTRADLQPINADGINADRRRRAERLVPRPAERRGRLRAHRRRRGGGREHRVLRRHQGAGRSRA